MYRWDLTEKPVEGWVRYRSTVRFLIDVTASHEAKDRITQNLKNEIKNFEKLQNVYFCMNVCMNARAHNRCTLMDF